MRVGVSTSGPRQADAVRRALAVTVDGEPLFTSFQSTWNVLEPSAGAALAEAAAAGARVIVKEAVANGRLAPGGADPRRAPRRGARGRRDTTVDALAIAAALAQPWAWRVLSGAVDSAQVASNAAAADRALPGTVAVELAASPRTRRPTGRRALPGRGPDRVRRESAKVHLAQANVATRGNLGAVFIGC